MNDQNDQAERLGYVREIMEYFKEYDDITRAKKFDEFYDMELSKLKIFHKYYKKRMIADEARN